MTSVLDQARPVRRGGPSNIEALATKFGDHLERVGRHLRELELLIIATVTLALLDIFTVG